MAEFEFKRIDGFEWVDAGDVRRVTELEHFFIVDTREYAEKLILNKGIDHIRLIDGVKVLRAYVEKGVWFISSKNKLYPISKAKEYGKMWIYKKPIKSKKEE